MNPRVLKVIAVVWGVGLLGTYVACRNHSGSERSAPLPSSKLGVIHPETAPTTQVLPGSKSFAPALIEPTPEPPSGDPRMMPGSKSAAVEFFDSPPPPASQSTTEPARKREFFRGSKSGNVDLDPANILFADEPPVSQPATAPAAPKP